MGTTGTAGGAAGGVAAPSTEGAGVTEGGVPESVGAGVPERAGAVVPETGGVGSPERISLTLGAPSTPAPDNIETAGPVCLDIRAKPRLLAKNRNPKTVVALPRALGRARGCIMVLRLAEVEKPPPEALPSVFCNRIRPIIAKAIRR